MTMKAYLFGCVAVLALAGCASHPARCGGRLTPINGRPIRSELTSGPDRVPAYSGKKERRT